MKTAEEIIQHIVGFNYLALNGKYRDMPCISINEAKTMIAEARKQTIQEIEKGEEV